MRMNTDARKRIFCLVMTSEDYIDAAMRLHKLGTKNQTERDVMFVLLECCLKVSVYCIKMNMSQVLQVVIEQVQKDLQVRYHSASVTNEVGEDAREGVGIRPSLLLVFRYAQNNLQTPCLTGSELQSILLSSCH